MSRLPTGWEWAALEDLAAPEPRAMTDGPFGSNLKSSHYVESGPRVIRLQNIGFGEFIDEQAHISDEHFESLRAHEARAGDLVVASLGQDLPRACLVPPTVGPAIVKADCIRVRLHSEFDARYVNYALQRRELRQAVAEQIHGVGRPRLGMAGIRELSIPVAPAAEQVRIVAAIEEHLSRLHAGDHIVRSVLPRLTSMRRASVSSLIEPEWPRRALGEVTINYDGRRIPLKRADRANRAGPYPYYGASGVIDSIDGFLFDGDYLLIAEDGANLATRSKPIAFSASGQFWVNNHAHVVQPVEGVDRGYLELVINGADIQRSITGSAQPKLTQANLNRIEVPIPPPTEQVALVAEHERVASLLVRLSLALSQVEARSASVRRSLLAAAFTGQLVPQDPDDEPASALLDRIQAERAAAPIKIRRKARVS